jgi:hypothetical protein
LTPPAEAGGPGVGGAEDSRAPERGVPAALKSRKFEGLPMRAAEVSESIGLAWHDYPRPPDDRLVPDSWGEYSECLAAFRSLEWSEVSSDMVMRGRSCVYFFTVEALAYFLPPFMITAMNERSGEWDVSEHALIGIRLLFEDDSRRARVISAAQVEAIRAFLLVMRAKADTKEAVQDVMSSMALLPAQQS